MQSFMQTSWQQTYGGQKQTQAEATTAATQPLTPTTPNPTPPEDTMGTNAQSSTAHNPTTEAQESHRPSSSSHKSRSWERVEQGLIAIRRIAQTFDDSQTREIVAAAETALVDLLVDTPTAAQLEDSQSMRPGTADRNIAPTAGDSNSEVTAAALQAAQQLGELARSLLAQGGEVRVSYAMVAPQVAALIDWFGTLEQANIAVHVQLPPILTPLREVLNEILSGNPGGTSQWAKLIAVTEALETLLMGNSLTHPANVISLDCGAGDSTLMHTEAAPEWYRAVETLRSLLRQVRTWPPHMLPTIREAAMNLVRGIAAVTPEEVAGGETQWQPEPWWYQDRHHGLGDTARASTSPRGVPRRRPRSPSDNEEGDMSDKSHRRRRLLAEHLHGGT